jgi:hypothetical protein
MPPWRELVWRAVQASVAFLFGKTGDISVGLDQGH